MKKGLDVDQTEDAILRLKAMLWALEALRVVDDQLRESLEKVREGKEKMQNYIQQVSTTSLGINLKRFSSMIGPGTTTPAARTQTPSPP